MTSLETSRSAHQPCREPKNAEKIDPAKAAAGVARWRRALAEVLGEDPGARLDRPDRKLTMLRIFGSTRRLADLCLKHPAAAGEALSDGASSVLAVAARDLGALGGGVGGAEALYGALAPIKGRADVAIAVAEISGAWSASEAAAARADLGERLVEAALSWLVRGAVSRGELPAQDADASLENVFVLAGGDFAHEDLAPYGPLELAVIYDEQAFPGPAARMAERAFVRIGAELREAFEGKPGDYPLFCLKTPLGSGVSGAGLTESRARVRACIDDEQQAALRAWIATARVVAGDRTAGGVFMEETEEAVWKSIKPFAEDASSALSTASDDPRRPFRRIADAFRFSLGAKRPVFRTASARIVFETAAKSELIPDSVAARLVAGDELAQWAASNAQMMRGASAFGASREDESEALARLCGFRRSDLFRAALDGMHADASNIYIRLHEGPLAEFDRYRESGAEAGDAGKLEDLGFSDGADLSCVIDRWVDLAAAGAEDVRFSAIAPGLLTQFGETQNPDQAARLFDEIVQNLTDRDEVRAILSEESPSRDGLVNALGCFGAAVAPLCATKALAQEFTADRGAETPQSGAEWLKRFTPPPSKEGVESLSDWRRQSIARIALYAAAGDMGFDAAADALDAVNNASLETALAIAVAETGSGEALALHIFDTPARGLPGAPTSLGFISTEAKAGDEKAARRFMEIIAEAGEGFFALTPDVTHRPGGAAGPLAAEIPAFKSYIQSEAVASDQIMLARTRIIAGAPEARAAAMKAVRGNVANPKRADILFRDLDRARAQRLRRDKSATEWDFDQVEGGLHDVELIISTLIYRHAAAQPSIQELSVDEALDVMGRANLVPADTLETLKGARAFWTRLATVRALARWSNPHLEPVRRRFGALLARAAEVERFQQVRPLMRGYAGEAGRLYGQLVLGRPSLGLVANG